MRQSTANLSDEGCLVSGLSDTEVIRYIGEGNPEQIRVLLRGFCNLERENWHREGQASESAVITAISAVLDSGGFLDYRDLDMRRV